MLGIRFSFSEAKMLSRWKVMYLADNIYGQRHRVEYLPELRCPSIRRNQLFHENMYF